MPPSSNELAITWQKRLFRLRIGLLCLFLGILSFLMGCPSNDDSSVTIKRIKLKAPAEGLSEGTCRVRYHGRNYELTDDRLQECRDILKKLYESEVIFVDRASTDKEYYTLEYCSPRSGDVLAAIHFHLLAFSVTDGSFRVDIDGVGTTYVPEAIGLQLHHLVAYYNFGYLHDSEKKASD